MSRVPSEVRIFESSDKLFDEAAKFILALAEKSNRFTLSLSGGSTPQGLYERMAQPDLRKKFPWSRMHFFFGDERCVPETDPRSNYRMVREALFTPAEIPAAQIHPVPVALSSPLEIAVAYEKEMADFFKAKPGQIPSFNLILLGLGEDGHTASLFPEDQALQRMNRFVTAAKLQTQEPRITMTFPVINHAGCVLFLVSGEKKAEMVKNILKPVPSTSDFPARRVNPSSGQLFWFLDRDAASLIA